MISIQPTTVVAHPYSGDYRIDVLLENPNFRWNAIQPFGSPVEVSYSFMAAAPVYADPLDAAGFTPMIDAQKTVVRQILADISAVTGLTFREIADTTGSFGQIRLGNNAQGQASDGYAFYPDPGLASEAGDVYINNQDLSNFFSITPGTYAYATLVHEIGHALGLKHPGNYGSGAAAAPGNYLAASADTEANSVMSLVGVSQGQQRDFFGPYDLLALQYLYGSRPYNTGANTYSLGDGAGQILQLIIDSGGLDTFDASANTIAATIDLREGKSSSIGRLANGTPALADVQIAFGTVIENAVGTSGNDTIIGNAANNMIVGGGGNDTIDGGAGVDTAVFSGTRNGYAIAGSGSAWSVADKMGTRDGLDTLTNVERLKFSDVNIALDIDGSAGSVAKILGAVFGASSLSNELYAGIGLELIDGGMGIQDLALLALNTALGTGFSNNAEVTLLYQNLFGSAPRTADLDFWTESVVSNQYTQVTLAMLAADTSINAYNIQLTGLMVTGLEYT